MQCPACSTEVPAGSENSFCEECGSPLNAPAQAAAGTCACGAPLLELDDEGYCGRCGRHHRAAEPEDHREETAGPELAGVSDRGLRHERNEDRFGLMAGPTWSALVVCDGVSSSRSPEIASSAVVRGVLDFLREPLATLKPGDAGLNDPEKLLREALAHANQLLLADAGTRRSSRSQKESSPPSTTVVAALLGRESCTVAWLGDSRAYWLAGGTALQLTRDHSWLNDVVSAGVLSAAEAAQSPRAHAITRWMGADADDAEPEIVTHSLGGSGTLLLCTDGLWNYAPAAGDMARLFAGCPTASPAETARGLVAFALERGGQDNITVVLGCPGGRTIQTTSPSSAAEPDGEPV